MSIYILRHGQTDLNVARKLQGRLDVPLNETGIRQAEQLAEILRERELTFEQIWSSPLDRAQKTGEIVTGQSRETFHTDPRLAEMDFGPLEGAPYRDLPGDAQMFFTDPEHFRPAEGHESMVDLVARLREFLEELKPVAAAAEGNLLLLSHGTTIHAMLVYLRGKDMKDFWDEDVHNCDLIRVDLVGDDYVVHPDRIGIIHSWDFFSPTR
ncbi:MAG: histidine phosphatase family protein [Mogibacterium sp.]|nr:histidine phosphatase family protein [Mogibacterium sp.]